MTMTRGKDSVNNETRTVIDQLIAARHRAGLTQRELAKATGFTPSYVADIERGRNEPSISRVVRYAQAVGMEIHIGEAHG